MQTWIFSTNAVRMSNLEEQYVSSDLGNWFLNAPEFKQRTCKLYFVFSLQAAEDSKK